MAAGPNPMGDRRAREGLKPPKMRARARADKAGAKGPRAGEGEIGALKAKCCIGGWGEHSESVPRRLRNMQWGQDSEPSRPS